MKRRRYATRTELVALLHEEKHIEPAMAEKVLDALANLGNGVPIEHLLKIVVDEPMPEL